MRDRTNLEAGVRVGSLVRDSLSDDPREDAKAAAAAIIGDVYGLDPVEGQTEICVRAGEVDLTARGIRTILDREGNLGLAIAVDKSEDVALADA